MNNQELREDHNLDQSRDSKHTQTQEIKQGSPVRGRRAEPRGGIGGEEEALSERGFEGAGADRAKKKKKVKIGKYASICGKMNAGVSLRSGGG
jgi:hypothetical protein